MSLAIGREKPKSVSEKVTLKYGAYVIIALFLTTIVTAVSFHNFLALAAGRRHDAGSRVLRDLLLPYQTP